MTNFLLTGGGTAGHVNPMLTIASLLAERNETDNIFVLGTRDGLESRLVPEAGFRCLLSTGCRFPEQ